MMEFYEDEKGEYRWRITAGNGEIIAASSEGYRSKDSAVGNAMLAAEALRKWVEGPAANG